jgi:hypothetical protein
LNLKILKRRAEMLDAVSTGLHPSAVVSQLAKKYGVTERALWSDWQRREKWVPVLLSLEKYAEFTDVIEQKLNAVQKAAWSIYLKASNDNARVGALELFLRLWRFTGTSFKQETSWISWTGWRRSQRNKLRARGGKVGEVPV